MASALVALAVTAGVTGCGSDDKSDTATGTSTSATTSAAGHGDHAAATAPSAADLQATLLLLADPAKPTADKTAVVVDGAKRQANIEALNQALAGYGALTFAVSDVKVEGTKATAQVVTTSPHGAAPAMPMTWEHVDGKWKLTDASACTMLAFVAPCAP
ncbi:hypothetical protein AB0H76_09120 [Nocardia sp. NPDC050712]|uniref:hypothetical protein n=1 Tax=Nocardia sp. NPDC050712 TaxID=3155518 RepID=UPI00340784A4